MGDTTRYAKPFIELGGLVINFKRTCIVEEPQTENIPTGLGFLPIFRVKDFRGSVPAIWDSNAFFLPMYPQEAAYISFPRGYLGATRAIVVGIDGKNCISGSPLNYDKRKDLEIRLQEPQDYIVVPKQQSFETFRANNGKIYQFTSRKVNGDSRDDCQVLFAVFSHNGTALKHLRKTEQSGPDNCMSLNVYADPYGIGVWKNSSPGIGRVYIVSEKRFEQMTGLKAIPTPLDYRMYERIGIPWFAEQRSCLRCNLKP